MRADRLVSVLLLLQRRGKATVAEIAAELEVSPRTVRRDLESLAISGVPVYSQPGRGGGWSLLGGARTDLTGLRSDEAEALFLVAGPAASATPELKQALRKLVQALPEPLRASAEAAGDAVVIDPSQWSGHRREIDEPIHLRPLQQAVVSRHRLELTYDTPGRGRSTRTISPLGLIEKASVWYVVADTDAGHRLFRLSRIHDLSPTNETFVRPSEFDLDAAWREITDDLGDRWGTVSAVVAATPWTIPVLREVLSGRITNAEHRTDERYELMVAGPSIEALASTLAGFGSAIEVLEPSALRDRLGELGTELLTLYQCTPLQGAQD